MKTLDKYVIFSLSMCVIYTIVDLLIFMKTGSEPVQLTICFFALFGGEVVAAALIKIFDLKGDKTDDINTNEEENNE